MRSIKWYKYVFWLGWFFIIISGELFSQNLKITNVSMLENNHIQIIWDITDLSDASDLGLYRDGYDGPCYSFHRIFKVPSLSTTSFTDSLVNVNRVRSYQLQIPGTGQGGIIRSNVFNTIYTRLDLDTCQKEVNLTWSRTFTEQPQTCPDKLNDSITIDHYNIWRSADGGNHYSQIGSIEREKDTSRIDTTFTDSDIEYDRTYRYYIEGVLQSDTTIKSKSNRVSVNTEMPDDPEYINLDSLSTRNGNIHLSFSIDEDSELTRYVLLRSEGDRGGRYDTLNVYNQPGQTIHYTDESVEPTKDIYFYHLAAVNQCGALTTRSDTLSNLLIQVTQQNLAHLVNWNPFSYLDGSNVSYVVEREGGDQNKEKTLLQPPFTDDIEVPVKDAVSSEFCYHVTARIDHPSGRQSFVSSYKTCVYVKPQIFLPNAFIPNAQIQKNRGFRPEFTFIPQHYLLIVYDRTGRKVYESGNPRDKWKGRIQGGEKAPAGTYTYYLEVKNPGDPMIQKSGEVTLIYR